MGKPPSFSSILMKSCALLIMLATLIAAQQQQRSQPSQQAQQQQQQQAMTPDYASLTLNKISRNYRIDEDETKYFKLLIDPKEVSHLDPDEDLIIKVFAEDMNQGDPDVFISKTNKKPNRVSNSQWACSTFGKDTCTINSSQVSLNDIFYVGVRCGSTYDGFCTFSIQPTLKTEILLEDGLAQELEFKQYEAKVFKFHLPAKTRDEAFQVTSLVVTATPLLPTDEKMSLYASTKGSISPNQEKTDPSLKRGTAGWRKGQTLRLAEKEDTTEWCNDCFVTVLLDVTTAGKYQITAKTNMGTVQLQDGVKIDDVAYYGESQCYKYFIKEASSTVNVRMAQFSGVVSYVFNYGQIPASFEEAQFKQAEFGNSALVITSAMRSRQGATGLYYLCVYAHMTSTYSVQVMETATSKENYQYLEDGWDQSGEVIGTEMSVFLYKTPPLEFKGEDIAVEFILTSVSGEIPKMYAQFCKQSLQPAKCADGLSKELFLNPSKNGFEAAKAAGKALSLIIDHDEVSCQNDFNSECYYTIVVLGQGRTAGDVSKFQLTGIHSQQNYYVLSEGLTVADWVNLGSYRYYSFTLPPSPPKINDGKPVPHVTNVTFTLNSLHGDADLFVSRKHKYPNRMDYEKNSVRTSDSYDIVYFDSKDSKEELSGTFYIAVYSYQYSSYNINVKVDRSGASNMILDRIQSEKKTAQKLIEGIPIRGAISKVDDDETFKIEVKQIEGFERPIKIQVSPLAGKFKILCSVENIPNQKASQWSTYENLLVIKPTDPNFKREGTYFVKIVPKLSFFDAWRMSLAYSYLISYLTEDSFLYLKSSLPLENTQLAGQLSYNYFRHFITQFNRDLSLSMTVFSGNPVLFASFDPEQKWPNNTTPATFSSKDQSLMASSGKALFFPKQMISVQNPGCSSSLSESSDACVLYMSVNCAGTDQCRYSLNLNYENGGPQSLIVGQPLHSVVKDGSFNYYYMLLDKEGVQQNQQIVAVLSSVKGNADLYVKYIDNPQKSNPEDWSLPNQQDYRFKSTQLAGNQDMIKITVNKDQELLDCFNRFNKQYGDQPQCALVFGVYSPVSSPSKQASQQTTSTSANKGSDLNQGDQLSSRYNFVVYFDMMQLVSKVPVIGAVEQDQFQYFIYEATCDDCTIMVSLSPIGFGDPDLYINIGDEKLPSRDLSDIVSSTLKSEVVMINLKHPYFETRKLKSMKGPYLLGVYGKKKSNFTISITQEKYPIGTLLENSVIKNIQEPFEAIYYAWYNLDLYNKEQKDIRISLNVLNGKADLYINTFVESETSQSMVDKLPQSKRLSSWVLENVDPKTSASQRSLVIVNQERNYCVNCFYLIGVVSHELKTEYSLQLDALDQADFSNAQILKLGENYHASFDKTMKTQVYRFILDDASSPIQIVQKVDGGDVSTYLSFTESETGSFQEIENTRIFTLEPEDPNFKTEQMYYLIVRPQSGSSASHSIMIMQQRTVLKLADGLPQQLQFKGQQDTNKLMLFSIPDGSYTFQIQVKSLTPNFFPKVYVKYYEDIEKEVKGMEFPPGGPSGYFICKNWDYKLGIMSYQEKFDNIKGGKAGLALSMIDSSVSRAPSDIQQVQITVSATPILKMTTGQTYIGTLEHSSTHRIYTVDQSVLNQKGYLKVELSPCIGETEFQYLDNPSQANKLHEGIAQPKFTSSNFKRGAYSDLIELPRKSLYIMVRQPKSSSSEFETTSHKGQFGVYTADYLIKATFVKDKQQKSTEYLLPNDGSLIHTMQSGGAEITWGVPLWFNDKGKGSSDISYTLVATKDERAKLDSQCVLRKEVASKFVLANFPEQKDTTYILKTPVEGQRYYINVIAKIKASPDSDPEYIPYTPIEIYVPKQSHLFGNLLTVFFTVICVFGTVGIIYMFRSQLGASVKGIFGAARSLGEQRRHNAYYQQQQDNGSRNAVKAIELSSMPSKKKEEVSQSSMSNVGSYQPVSMSGAGNGVDESFQDA